ncbi:Eukaryotic translation initiation factor 3 subunit L [Dirofilaria immitis]|nr:Eukaryotic translation initiation factor 3 subunit L [Dirofilaria immitis]
MVRDSFDGGHTGDPERDLAYEREHIRRDALNDEVVPDDVAQYLIYFKRMIDEENVVEIHNLYEHGFPDLTERYFQQRLWPNEEAVENIVGSDSRIFIILYKELYFRHVYTRMQRGPSLAHRFDSYQNYQELFCEILTPEKQPLSLQLPNVWLWDIIDEFVYQAWNIYPVLNILYSLLAKSQIDEQLLAIREGRNPDDVADEFGRSALYFKLGYFSLIGLLRTHVLLGDYHQALKTVENLELDPKGLYNTVPSCLVTFHYFVGFSHMMMRNYGEATKIFVNCLLYIQRTKSVQQQNQQQKKNFQYDVIGKTNEQLYHLLAICLTLQPQRIDDSIQSQLYERTGERMNHMSNGNIDEFRLAFQQGCPKFLSPTTVVYEGPNQAKEPLLRQCNAFLEEIESQIMLPILRGYLKLYTTLPTRKLASFMDVSDADYDSFVGKLLSFKMIVNELGKECMDRCEIDDSTTDLDFYVDKDMIIIADTKVARRIGEYFVKQIQKLQEVNRKLKELPVIPTGLS